MADTQHNAEADARERQLPQSQGARYKFMTSILVPSYMRGMYLKPLEHVTPDAKVPFQRIVVGLVLASAMVIFALKQVVDNAERAFYIALPMLLLALSVCAIAVIYLLSSRDKSMLASVAELNFFKIEETARSRKNLHIGSVGISEITKSGKLIMGDGRVGYVYIVRGELCPSTMPEAAEALASARYSYLVGRSATSQEMRLTAIAPNKFEDQLSALESIDRKWERAEKTPQNDWRRAMTSVQWRYMDDLSHQNHQLTLEQYVILTEIDDDSLRRSASLFERQLRGRVYDTRLVRMTDRNEIERALGGVCMKSTVRDND